VSPGEAAPDQGGRIWYEITVLGGLGPVVRAAFREARIVQREPCTVFRLHGEGDLDWLLDFARRRGLPLPDIRRVSPIQDEPPYLDQG
jgi:hypothetical protein